MAKVIFGRPFGHRVIEDGEPKSHSSTVEVEFNLPDKYNKVLKPLFGDTWYDVDIFEEKGVITVTLKPKADGSDETESCD